MINDINKCIVNCLFELYPEATIYNEDIPENFKSPSFLITLKDYKYYKRINNKFNSELYFEILYFSDKDDIEIKSDCFKVQEDLFRNFDILEKYRAINKQVNIVDNVLHFTFKIMYSEIKEVPDIKMSKKELKTNLKE